MSPWPVIFWSGISFFFFFFFFFLGGSWVWRFFVLIWNYDAFLHKCTYCYFCSFRRYCFEEKILCSLILMLTIDVIQTKWYIYMYMNDLISLPSFCSFIWLWRVHCGYGKCIEDFVQLLHSYMIYHTHLRYEMRVERGIKGSMIG